MPPHATLLRLPPFPQAHARSPPARPARKRTPKRARHDAITLPSPGAASRTACGLLGGLGDLDAFPPPASEDSLSSGGLLLVEKRAERRRARTRPEDIDACGGDGKERGRERRRGREDREGGWAWGQRGER